MIFFFKKNNKFRNIEIQGNNEPVVEEKFNASAQLATRSERNSISNLSDRSSIASLSDRFRIRRFSELASIKEYPASVIKKVELYRKIENDNFKWIQYMCEFKPNNHIILSDSEAFCWHIFDAISFNYIKPLNFKGRMGFAYGLCVIEPNEQILCADDWNKEVYLIDKKYSIVKEYKLEKERDGKERWYYSCDFDNKNKTVYITDKGSNSLVVLDDEFNLIRDVKILKNTDLNNSKLGTIKVIYNKIYICDNGDKKGILVFDMELNLIDILSNISFSPFDLIVNPKNMSYIYVIDYNVITIFNVHSKQCIDKVQVERAVKGLILNSNKLIINCDHKQLFIYDIIS